MLFPEDMGFYQLPEFGSAKRPARLIPITKLHLRLRKEAGRLVTGDIAA